MLSIANERSHTLDKSIIRSSALTIRLKQTFSPNFINDMLEDIGSFTIMNPLSSNALNIFSKICKFIVFAH